MTQFEGQQASYEPQPPKKGWFGRNWLWFVPTIILLPVLCCCGGGGALVWFSMGQVFSLPPYEDTLTELRADAEVVAALGSPIDAPDGFGDLMSMMQAGGQFNVNQSGSTVDFDAVFPVTGPNGSGTVTVEATSTDGNTWTYTIREVQIDSTGEVIDLMPAGSIGSGLLDDAAELLDQTPRGEGDSNAP